MGNHNKCDDLQHYSFPATQRRLKFFWYRTTSFIWVLNWSGGKQKLWHSKVYLPKYVPISNISSFEAFPPTSSEHHQQQLLLSRYQDDTPVWIFQMYQIQHLWLGKDAPTTMMNKTTTVLRATYVRHHQWILCDSCWWLFLRANI